MHVLRNRRSLGKPCEANPCLAQGTLDTTYLCGVVNLARVVSCNSDLHENPSTYSYPRAIGLIDSMASHGNGYLPKVSVLTTPGNYVSYSSGSLEGQKGWLVESPPKRNHCQLANYQFAIAKHSCMYCMS